MQRRRPNGAKEPYSDVEDSEIDTIEGVYGGEGAKVISTTPQEMAQTFDK